MLHYLKFQIPPAYGSRPYQMVTSLIHTLRLTLFFGSKVDSKSKLSRNSTQFRLLFDSEIDELVSTSSAFKLLFLIIMNFYLSGLNNKLSNQSRVGNVANCSVCQTMRNSIFSEPNLFCFSRASMVDIS